MTTRGRNLDVAIEADLPNVLNLIRTHPVTVVESAIGTGKNLGIPYDIARNGSRVLVAVPTSKIAISLHRELIRRLRKLKSGIRVGYATASDVQVFPDTQIIYASARYVYRKMLALFRSDRINFAKQLADVIVIDDYDRGEVDSDMIYLLWKHGVTLPDISVPRLVLTSAGPIELDLSPEILGEFVTDKVSSYTVNVSYSEHNYNVYDRSLLNDTADLAIEFHNTGDRPGHFLIFAAGVREVSTIAKRIKKTLSGKNVMVLQAHGVMNADLMGKINDPAGTGIRKIIVTTSAAMALITTRNISVVIDTMAEKREIKSSGGGTKLVSETVAKNIAKQRKSMAGRTMNGACHRMITKSAYNKLQQTRPAEISVMSLHNQVMDLLGAGINPPSVLSISSDKYTGVLGKLKRLNLIDKREKVTEAGVFVSSLPLGLETGTMIWKWLSDKPDISVLPCVVIAVMIDRRSGSYFSSFNINNTRLSGDRQRRLESKIVKDKHSKFRGYSDIHTYFKLWKGLTDSLGGLDGSYYEIRDWCTENAISYDQIKDVYYTVQKIMRNLSRGHSERSVAIGRIASTRKAVNHLEGILKSVYNNAEMTKIGLGKYRDRWKGVYSLDNVQTRNLLRVESPDVIYTILTRKIRSTNIITCAFARKPENQRIRVPAGFTLGLTPSETAQVSLAINEESDAADKLDAIVDRITTPES